jgi:hypothetical protein
MSPDMFHSNFRMSRMHFDTLIELLSGHGGLEYQPNLRRFDSRKAVAMMLARLSTTATCREVGNMFGVARGVVSKVTYAVACVLLRRLSKLVRTPTTAAEWMHIAERWAASGRSRIANVVGAIDGCHIPIWKPSGPGAAVFCNRKQRFSFNVQAVVDDRGLFISLLAGPPGSSHDASLESRSAFARCAQATIPAAHYLLADSGYAAFPWQLTPYKDMHYDVPLTPVQTLFNRLHASARSVVEHTFGAWKSRWRKLTKMDMRLKEHTLAFIRAAAVLHNYVEMSEHNWPDVNTAFDEWPEPVAQHWAALTEMTDAEREEMSDQREMIALGLYYD